MSARLFSGYLLLALAVVSQCGTVLDRATVRTAIEQQWQAPIHHQNAPRLSHRHASGIPGGTPSVPALDRFASLLLAPHPDPTSPLLADIFIPPRA